MTVEIIKTTEPQLANPSASSKTKCSNRSWWSAMVRGFNRKCPSCGTGKLFHSFLKVSTHCPSCNEELHHHRADDAPPYFTIFVVGHILLPSILAVEKIWKPEMWVHLSLWFPLTIILSVILLPRFKGAILGLQWALCMHGFEFSALCAPQRPTTPSLSNSPLSENTD